MNRFGEGGRGGDLAFVESVNATLEVGPQAGTLRVAQREFRTDALGWLPQPVGARAVGPGRTAGVPLFGVVGETLFRFPKRRHVVRQGRVRQLAPAATEVRV